MATEQNRSPTLACRVGQAHPAALPEPDAPAMTSAPDPPALDTATSLPPQSPAPLPDPWWSVALVLLVSLGIAVGIIALWASAARPPAPVERRLPLASGTTLSYRITSANGTTSYLSENIERRQGINALDLLDISTRLLVASRITGIPQPDLSTDQYSAFRKANAGQVVVARVADTTYDSSGQITPTTSLLLVRPDQIELLSVDGQGFVPRDSRLLLYIGYVLLSVSVAHWYLVSHNIATQIVQSDINAAGFLALGLPLAYLTLVEGGERLLRGRTARNSVI